MVSGLLLVAERGHDQCVNHWGARHPSCTAHIHQQGLNGQWSSLGDDQSVCKPKNRVSQCHVIQMSVRQVKGE